jgi:hypothetical protein
MFFSNRISLFGGRSALLLSVVMWAFPGIAQQPPALQLNVPYHCGNNIIVVVKHCEQRNGTDLCSLVKGPANGPLGDEISMPRAQAAAIGLLCPPQGGSASQTAKNGAAVANGRTFNPPYLSDMPAPARILAEIKGKDAEDTGERQMGAFVALVKIMDDMAWGLGHRYVNDADTRALTPDERQIRLAYQTAYADLWHKVTNKEGHVYDHDRDLRNELLAKFFSENFRAQYFQSDKNAAAGYKAFQDKMYAPGVSASSQPGVPGVQQGMRNDAGSVAARRCLESGRSELECIGEGLKVGLNDLTGGNLVSNITGETAAQGLRLSGAYSGPTGNKLHIEFGQEKAGVSCGPLLLVQLPYVVERTANEILVKIPINPKPLVVTFRADGTLAGPAEIAVNGLVPVGHGGSGGTSAPGYEAQTHTTTQERQIDAAEARNYEGTDAVHQNGMDYSVSEQVTTTTYEPATPVANYHVAPLAPRTERCAVGTMQGRSSSGTAGEALTQMLDPSAKKKAPVPPGLRLAGMYAGQSGFRIEFREDSATVECGEAHVAGAYAVQDNAGQISVRIQNGATPFALSLQPNGTLTGSGTVDVAGRVVTGSSGDNINYASRNARCAIGTLMPKGGTAAARGPQ